MKNLINLTDKEREIVNKFVNMKYPSVYKTDNTDRILFVELVDFDVCQYLLGKIHVNNEQYNHILTEYERYLAQTDDTLFDQYAHEHFELMVKLMELFKKHYSM